MTDCTHHWDIPPANGPTSVGICRNCGTEREFQNGAQINSGGFSGNQLSGLSRSQGPNTPFQRALEQIYTS